MLKIIQIAQKKKQKKMRKVINMKEMIIIYLKSNQSIKKRNSKQKV